MSGDRGEGSSACLVALAGLSGMGPARLSAALARFGPEGAWHVLSDGRAGAELSAVCAVNPEVVARWRSAAAQVDTAALWASHGGADPPIGVVEGSDESLPEALRLDQEAPAVLFHRGPLEILRAPRVAIVGTRRCTHAGRSVARELGADLAQAGVCVVSGLALGIDGDAHAGALSVGAAAPAAVVGTGLDVVYPRRHAELWSAMAASGLVLSEYPLGTQPERWRFPARNRLIAALADVVVVVESHVRGGSMHTVEAALERDRTVMAVPGPVRSPASAGTNALLAAGSAPARDAADVLVALGLDSAASSRARPVRPPPDGIAGEVLDVLGFSPATLEQLVLRSGFGLGPVAVALARLAADGWVVSSGSWYERTAPGQ